MHSNLYSIVSYIIFYTIEYTLPVMVSCTDCNQKFRTYIPGTDCLLPDGSLQCHQEPQDTCPECSGGYGIHFNTDIFPDMAENLGYSS